MPTSGPGSSLGLGRRRAGPRGFSLLELLVVLAIVAISVGAVSLALRDGTATRLERDGVRLAALLEMARAESRATGSPVRWVPGRLARSADAPGLSGTPGAEPPADFRFIGLSGLQPLPQRWLDERISAQVTGGAVLVLGPDAILPAQRVVLSLEDRRLELASDGLGPFAIADAIAATP